MTIHDWTKVEPADFHDFQQGWSAVIRTKLNQRVLPDGFYSQIERAADEIVPDVTLHDDSPPTPVTEDELAGSLAVAIAPPLVRLVTEMDDRGYLQLKNRIAVRHASDKRTVAVIEIVSHGNKSGERDFRRFVEKSTATIDHGIHLVVIDLYPPNKRDPHGIHAAIWNELGAPDDSYQPPPGKSLTLVSYAARLMLRAYVEPTAVGDSLTAMPLFLTDDRYVPLPLAESYDDAFAGVPAPLKKRLA